MEEDNGRPIEEMMGGSQDSRIVPPPTPTPPPRTAASLRDDTRCAGPSPAALLGLLPPHHPPSSPSIESLSETSSGRARCSVQNCRRFAVKRSEIEAESERPGSHSSRRQQQRTTPLCHRHYHLRYGRHPPKEADDESKYRCCMYTSPQLEKYVMTESAGMDSQLTKVRLQPHQVRRQQKQCSEIVRKQRDRDIEDAVLRGGATSGDEAALHATATLLPPLCAQHKAELRQIIACDDGDEEGFAQTLQRVMAMCKIFHCHLSETSVRGILPLVSAKTAAAATAASSYN